MDSYEQRNKERADEQARDLARADKARRITCLMEMQRRMQNSILYDDGIDAMGLVALYPVPRPPLTRWQKFKRFVRGFFHA